MQDLEFEWDEQKSDKVYEERGFDFGFAAQAFLDPQAIHQPETRSRYGEDRFRIYGHEQGRLLIVAYTKRDGRVRIITAWKANSREIQDHTRWCLTQGNT
ncbi:BrnT family toxin [Synechococcus sp. CBW1107]|uniref:BrnT family toxin n=1 Tax=Synechococcus sp. CBW1107 TaxID=2789857 RepID=UPI002AD3BFE4|nr:BrnT family toxin [Synechococcus sp. CBW1107]CAK6697038.1 hypothetical protein IFHNHDMJ_02146 [Synechococcus sp. CBW1107]